ncbi:hypothetical protein C0Q70_02474 [Pomacea canaliculata]|uniref:Globin n=1 Tax=Pomacea canaliculata TaxID=400727 RepID=A0A2T7PQ09_POMCA|nr:hypothetical protein C0Q70_02474 [Pomacea canaliculata]
MGGFHSSSSEPPSKQRCFRTCNNDTTTCGAEVVRVAPPALDPSQKKMLLSSWQKLERDIAQVGVITFVGMFQTHPEVQGYFLPFTGLPLSDLNHLGTLRAHALRFMATVEKCMHRLDEPERMRDVLEGLGGPPCQLQCQRRLRGDHKKLFTESQGRSTEANGAEENAADMLGVQFVKAVKDHSEDWTPELEEAWHCLVRVITFYVKSGWVEKVEHGCKDVLHDKMAGRTFQKNGSAKTNGVEQS